MRPLNPWRRGFLVLSALGITAAVQAQPVQVAVAANFIGTAHALAAAYQAAGGAPVRLSLGSTGQLYAQIRNGAPFDVFLSADARRPRLLEAQGLAVAGSRYTYALGRLVLWSADPKEVDPHGRVLAHGAFRHLAIADPRTAPYGAAARQVLRRLGLWKRLQPRLVRGENIVQTFQFVASGAASLGFVAGSELTPARTRPTGSKWVVPAALYPPIRQQAVLLRHGAHRRAPRAFLAYLQSDAGRAIILRHGYGVPDTAERRSTTARPAHPLP
ncbi:MAG: molybdate ABC transporter substrate-binding protein [Gammaproteobacteria bacterium]